MLVVLLPKPSGPESDFTPWGQTRFRDPPAFQLATVEERPFKVARRDGNGGGTFAGENSRDEPAGCLPHGRRNDREAASCAGADQMFHADHDRSIGRACNAAQRLVR